MDKIQKGHKTINKDHLNIYPEKEKHNTRHACLEQKDLIRGCNATR